MLEFGVIHKYRLAPLSSAALEEFDEKKEAASRFMLLVTSPATQYHLLYIMLHSGDVGDKSPFNHCFS